MSSFCCIQNNINLSGISKVGPVSGAVEHLQRHILCLVGGTETLLLQFKVQDHAQLLIAEILKRKRRRDGKTTAEARVDVLEHVFHLILVPQQEHAAIVSGNALHLGYNGVDDRGLVGVLGTTTV